MTEWSKAKTQKIRIQDASAQLANETEAMLAHIVLDVTPRDFRFSLVEAFHVLDYVEDNRWQAYLNSIGIEPEQAADRPGYTLQEFIETFYQEIPWGNHAEADVLEDVLSSVMKDHVHDAEADVRLFVGSVLIDDWTHWLEDGNG